MQMSMNSKWVYVGVYVNLGIIVQPTRKMLTLSVINGVHHDFHKKIILSVHAERQQIHFVG